MTKEITKTKIKPNLSVKQPSLFDVIYVNDDKTTYEFVVDTLVNIFDYSILDAEEQTVNIHTTGSAIVATMAYEIAEHKGHSVTKLARDAGYPLVVRLEEHK